MPFSILSLHRAITESAGPWLLLGMKNLMLPSGLASPPLRPSRQKLSHEKTMREKYGRTRLALTLESQKKQSTIQPPSAEGICQPTLSSNRAQLTRTKEPQNLLGPLSPQPRFPFRSDRITDLKNKKEKNLWMEDWSASLLPWRTCSVAGDSSSLAPNPQLPINSRASVRPTKLFSLKQSSGKCPLLFTFTVWT